MFVALGVVCEGLAGAVGAVVVLARVCSEGGEAFGSVVLGSGMRGNRRAVPLGPQEDLGGVVGGGIASELRGGCKVFVFGAFAVRYGSDFVVLRGPLW